LLVSLVLVALRNLGRRPLRTTLTVVGAAAAIALFVSVRSITTDLTRGVGDVVEGYGPQLLVVQKRVVSPLQSHIAPADAAAIAALVGEERTTPILIGMLREPNGPSFLVLGTDTERTAQFRMVEGHPFARESREILMGQVASGRLGIHEGRTVVLGGETFTVTGVFSTGTPRLDGGLLMDLKVAQRLLSRENSLSVLLLRLSDRNEVASVAREIEKRFSRLTAQPGEQVVGGTLLLEAVRNAAAALGLIALGIATLVISNTLVMTIAERRREVGILLTVGWPAILIFTMLLIESVLLCLLGTALGIGLAHGILFTLSHTQAIGLGWVPVTVIPGVALESFGLSFVMGLLACLYPGIMAARTTPVSALRHE
jgi:putative ABC transport system permease protein